jgi:hypothetical protein
LDKIPQHHWLPFLSRQKEWCGARSRVALVNVGAEFLHQHLTRLQGLFDMIFVQEHASHQLGNAQVGVVAVDPVVDSVSRIFRISRRMTAVGFWYMMAFMAGVFGCGACMVVLVGKE